MTTTQALPLPASTALDAVPAAVEPRPALWPAAWALAQRELVRFLRQRNRVIGAFLTPLVFWVLLGFGMGNAFRAPGTDENFLTYFFPGTLLMTLLFTAIFATISLIEDRREGFMQGVLTAPVPRSAVVLGKAIGGTILAAGQAILLLPIAPFIGLTFTPVGYLIAIGFILLLSFALVSLGLLIAWPLTSTQGYHVAMNLLLMPLWFVSGAVFPVGASEFAMVRYGMWLNPLTWGLAGLRQGLMGHSIPSLPPIWLCAIVAALVAVGLFALASFVAGRPTRADVES